MRNGEYTLIIPPLKYPGKRYRGRYSYEHHVVWWEETGESLEKGYIIHHKNHNKRDNSFENLELMTKKEHHELHKYDNPREMWVLKCDSCDIEFEREARYIRIKQKRGQKYFFCSLSCSVRHQYKTKDRGSPGK